MSKSVPVRARTPGERVTIVDERLRNVLVEDAGLPVITVKACKANGAHNLYDAAIAASNGKLLRYKGFGRKALHDLELALEKAMKERSMDNFKRVKLKDMRVCVEQGIEFMGTNRHDNTDPVWGLPRSYGYGYEDPRGSMPTVWGEKRQYGPYTNGEPIERCYCVFSYRYSWPILVFSELTGEWYANAEFASQTTSRHLRMCKPEGVGITWMTVRGLIEIVNNGTAGHVRQIVKAA